MDSLISQVSEKVGFEEAVVRKAIGAVLKFFNDQAQLRNFDFSTVLSHLKGAEELMKNPDAQQAAAEGEAHSASRDQSPMNLTSLVITLLKLFGIMAILKQLLSTFFGDGAVRMLDTATDGAELAGVMDSMGIDHQSGAKMVRMLIDYMKDKVSPETLEQLVDVVPSLKTFLDDAKKDE